MDHINAKSEENIAIFLTRQDLMERYKIGRTTANELTKSWGFPEIYRIAPKTFRWKLSEVENWEDGQRMFSEIASS